MSLFLVLKFFININILVRVVLEVKIVIVQVVIHQHIDMNILMENQKENVSAKLHILMIMSMKNVINVMNYGIFLK